MFINRQYKQRPALLWAQQSIKQQERLKQLTTDIQIEVDRFEEVLQEQVATET
jgi:hypothetical protein